MRERPAGWPHQPQTVEGKCAVISGGTSGIGRALARLLASQGARVLIFGVDEDPLQQALEACKDCGEVHGVVADQTRWEEVQRVFAEADDKLGGIDILVNNAGVTGWHLLQHDFEEIERIVRVNFLGYMACAKEAIPRMEARGGGHIVNMGSMSAGAREPNAEIYVGTKCAVEGWSESLRKTVNPRNIRVSLVEPGLTHTSILKWLSRQPEDLHDQAKLLYAEDIAECILFCLTQPNRSAVVHMKVRPLNQWI